MTIYDRPPFDPQRRRKRAPERSRPDRRDEEDERGRWISHEPEEFRPRELGAGRHAGNGDFAGLGPKGYRRSDDRLKEEVCDRLTAARDIDASEIEVAVENGEVTLSGTVCARQMKRAAEDCAEEIAGVQQVHNRLRIEIDPEDPEGWRSGAGRNAH